MHQIGLLVVCFFLYRGIDKQEIVILKCDKTIFRVRKLTHKLKV